MNAPGSRKDESASPWMLVVSASLHAVLIIALIVASSLLFKSRDREEKTITTVKLIGPPPGPPPVQPLPDTITRKAEDSPRPELERSHAVEPAKPPPRQIVAPKSLAPKAPDRIKVKKRERKPMRVARPKKEKTKKKVEKKREDPNEYLKKRLTALRDKMKDKKDRQDSPATSDDSERRPDATLTDEQIARWFSGVRDRINAHWSVLRENRSLHRVTVVGVQLADNGQLLDATVDQSSGDPLFDRSAMWAVQQAAPFPPVPPRIRASIRKEGGLALRFTPRGMQ